MAIPVGSVCDGENVGTELPQAHALVHIHHVRVVEVGELGERVHGNENVARVCLQQTQRRETRALTQVMNGTKRHASMQGTLRETTVAIGLSAFNRGAVLVSCD